MADVIVIGAGMNGLSTAVLLALDGHDVTVLERDPAPPLEDPDEAWARWERRGVGQFRLPHFLLPCWRELADAELPEVVATLEARGGVRMSTLDTQPPEVVGPAQPDDDRFEVVTGRRPLIESALASVAEATFGVGIERGVAITGLAVGPGQVEGIPHVAGVVTDEGPRMADLVVDASGRRSPLPSWLAEIGARPPLEQAEDLGFVYYGRHFRRPDGSTPTPRAPLLQHYDSLSILTLPCDNGTWATAFVASARDRELRGLRHRDRWEAALAGYPAAAEWGDGEPISGIDVMAKLEDRRRRFVVDDQPVATGVLAVGDSWACTNPSLGRGTSIGLLHARCLRDLLREVPTQEAYKLALRWDEVTESVVGPLYDLTLAYDRHRLAEIEADVEGRPYETDDPAWAISKAMFAAARYDAQVLRAYTAISGLLATPDEVLAEPGVLERTIELGAGAPQYPLPGRSREELLEVVRGED